MSKGTFNDMFNDKNDTTDDDLKLDDTQKFLKDVNLLANVLADFVIDTGFGSNGIRLGATILKLQGNQDRIMQIIHNDDWDDSEFTELLSKATEYNNCINEWLERHNYNKDNDKQ